MATSDKYDRQLRLWGSNGQKALMNSKILLINADSVGTETLKNLVLPGVGMFTILDDFIVDQDDLGSNFFVLPNCLGKPRAEIVTELLCEMNADVTGYARVANFQNVFQTEPEYFTSFNLIITANMAENQLRPLAELCWKHGIPLLVSRAYGLIGTVRLQLKEHDIIESRPEADRFDLRIANPFPDLVNYCDSIDLASLSSIEHSHIPYIVILYKAIQNWKQQHNDSIPSTSAEKAQFRDQVKSMSRNFNNETNFQEAVKEAYRAYGCHEFSEELQSVLENHSDSSALNSGSKQFNFLATALSLFLQSNNHSIPLSGQIPDLTSTTELYVQLQQVYMKKATEDLKGFKHILHGLLEVAGLPSSTIPDDLIDTFCKNALNLQTVSTRSLAQELSDTPECGVVNEVLQDELYDDPLQTPILWYLALRATDAFHSRYARYPGEQEDPTALAADEDQVYKELVRLCTQQYQVDSRLLEEGGGGGGGAGGAAVKDADAMSMEDGGAGAASDVPSALITKAHAAEITRYGGCELHNISALIGGIAAQEAVKIITHQYVPLNNTYIYNGIASCGATYEL